VRHRRKLSPARNCSRCVGPTHVGTQAKSPEDRRTTARNRSLRTGDKPSLCRGEGPPSSLCRLCPIFMGSRDFDSKTAIWDSPAWSYDWRRLGHVLYRQRNDFCDLRPVSRGLCRVVSEHPEISSPVAARILLAEAACNILTSRSDCRSLGSHNLWRRLA
jgi:hypothetical protein